MTNYSSLKSWSKRPSEDSGLAYEEHFTAKAGELDTHAITVVSVDQTPLKQNSWLAQKGSFQPNNYAAKLDKKGLPDFEHEVTHLLCKNDINERIENAKKGLNIKLQEVANKTNKFIDEIRKFTEETSSSFFKGSYSTPVEERSSIPALESAPSQASTARMDHKVLKREIDMRTNLMRAKNLLVLLNPVRLQQRCTH